MIIDKKHFYDSYREVFGVIKDPVVKALDFLLDKFNASEVFSTKARISYALATIKRETAETFEPVLEGYWIKGDRLGKLYNYYQTHNPGALTTIFPNGKREPAYYGRGYVQLTHSFNYNKFTNILKLDLVNRPHEALDREIAFKIMEFGMENGSYTGKKLSNYFTDEGYDFYKARKIINGLDAASEIAHNAELFMGCINFIEAPAESIDGEDREVNPEPHKGDLI
jgi:hypothetical protein